MGAEEDAIAKHSLVDVVCKDLSHLTTVELHAYVADVGLLHTRTACCEALAEALEDGKARLRDLELHRFMLDSTDGWSPEAGHRAEHMQQEEAVERHLAVLEERFRLMEALLACAKSSVEKLTASYTRQLATYVSAAENRGKAMAKMYMVIEAPSEQ